MYTTDKIAEIIDAQQPICGTVRNIQHILTDSRSLVFAEETLFFAINTTRNDGHRYIGELYHRGVRAFVTERIENEWADIYSEAIFLKVGNTVKALQQLARAHREKFCIPVIGITGSNGKTTVKEWLYQILSNDYRITRSPRSYNSQIGVPLSVWGINSDTQLAIFEAGISQAGEMEALADIIQPDIAIITNAGTAHQENFNSIEEICNEKSKLLNNAKIAIYPYDDKNLAHAATAFKGKHITWSKHDNRCTMFIESVLCGSDGRSSTISYVYDDKEKRVCGTYIINNISSAAIDNSITCATACLYLGMSGEDIAQRMQGLYDIAMRLEVKEGQNHCTIINDTYNNDITSLEIALDYMMRRPENTKQRHTLILSDILQSNPDAEKLCQQLLTLIRCRHISKFIGIGPMLSCYLKPIAESDNCGIEFFFFETTEDFMLSDTMRNLHDEVILIKGARQFRFDRITDCLEKKVHETVLEVNLNALIDNYNFYRSLMPEETKLICMVKADAYGAGAIEVAKTLQDYRVEYLAVAVADEGVALRKAGITCNIMVMNPELSAFRTMFEYNLEPEIYSFRLLNALIQAARREGVINHPVHIKLDTGMHRLGFDPVSEIDQLIDVLQKQKAVRPCSIFTHFVGADDDMHDCFSEQQYLLFDCASRKFMNAFKHKIARHICNSAAIQHFPQWHMDMCRLGLGLYGVNPRDNSTIHNVSALKTTILQIHDIPAGESVGYSRRTILSRDSRIAAIPIGYADGLNRQLGNRNACCIVNGQPAQYVGNICMDVAMIDVTDISCSEGDSVEIFGPNLPVSDIAERIGTIPYEIMTAVSQRVKRVYFKE
ncbi:MAG: bifunctional UDP-N-acetylmuramoyl-tripeptide:D-alanyl-D-alanine ligase/alanine racemase [Prevotella sp.]|nr:bifunctional UDP-N-acetylmuramoyl-tripeptide:D-alanyl-D-alanine ligase/alanine racemase [Prevotella sp.]